MYQVLLPVSGIPDKLVILSRLALQCRPPVCTRLRRSYPEGGADMDGVAGPDVRC
jgi:hypothetical protein